jgi:flagellar protein FliO/FliZ
MMLTLGAVCLLAYLSLGKLLPRLMRVQQPIAGRNILQVVDRLPIDQRRSIMIIKTGEELYYLVGVTDHGINLLSRLDADDIDTALATAVTPEPPRLGRFAQALLGRSQKED